MCCELVYHNPVSECPNLPWLFLRGAGGPQVPHRVLVSLCFIKSDRQPSKHTDVYILFPFIWCQGLKDLFYFSTVTYTPFHCTSSFHLKSQQDWKKSEAQWEIAFPNPIFYYFKLEKLLHVTHPLKCSNEFCKCSFKKKVKSLYIHNNLSREQVKILQHHMLTMRQFIQLSQTIVLDAVPPGYLIFMASVGKRKPFQISWLWGSTTCILRESWNFVRSAICLKCHLELWGQKCVFLFKYVSEKWFI